MKIRQSLLNAFVVVLIVSAALWATQAIEDGDIDGGVITGATVAPAYAWDGDSWVRVAMGEGAASGGALRVIGAASLPFHGTNLQTTHTLVSAALTMGDLQCTNTDASNFAFLQIFDTTSDVTPGTTVPDTHLGIPAASVNVGFRMPIQFSNGLTVAATTTPTGSTMVDADEVACSGTYAQ